LGFVDIARAQQKGEDTTELLKSNPMVPEAQWKRYLVRLIPPVLFLVIVVIFYSTVLLKPDGSFDALFLTEVIRIPAILYLMVFFTCFVAWGMQSATNSMCTGSPKTPKTTNVQTGEEPTTELEPTKELYKVDAEAGSSEDSLQKEQQEQKELPSPGLSTGTVMAGFAVCYMLMVAISIVIEQINVDMVLILLTFVLVIIFTILALVAMVLMDKQMHRTSLGSPKLPSKND